MRRPGVSVKRIDDTFREVYSQGKLIARLYKNPMYYRNQWIIEKTDGIHFISQGYDCFTLKEAVKTIRKELGKFIEL
jgi:hypothetical protein